VVYVTGKATPTVKLHPFVSQCCSAEAAARGLGPKLILESVTAGSFGSTGPPDMASCRDLAYCGEFPSAADIAPTGEARRAQ
jgi:hypothetical protein